MKEFREIAKEDVINELKEGKDVRAIVLNTAGYINKGGDHIKEGVYQLHCRMAIADVTRYEKEDNVCFYVQNSEKE